MDSVYLKSAEIVRRVKLEMPISVTYLDVFSQSPITCSRDNVLAMLVSDVANIVVERQMNAALYVEFARFQRAAEFAAAQAEAGYRRWKAQRAAECREKWKGDKKPTKEEVESFYRNHDDYMSVASLPDQLRAQAGLFADIKEGFKMKSYAQSDQSASMRGHEGVLRLEEDTERVERLDEYGEAERLAGEAFRLVGSASAEAAKRMLAGESPSEPTKEPPKTESSGKKTGGKRGGGKSPRKAA